MLLFELLNTSDEMLSFTFEIYNLDHMSKITFDWENFTKSFNTLIEWEKSTKQPPLTIEWLKHLYYCDFDESKITKKDFHNLIKEAAKILHREFYEAVLHGSIYRVNPVTGRIGDFRIANQPIWKELMNVITDDGKENFDKDCDEWV